MKGVGLRICWLGWMGVISIGEALKAVVATNNLNFYKKCISGNLNPGSNDWLLRICALKSLQFTQ